MGNRMSSLDVAQYCGLAPALSEQLGSGRAAAVSSAFHALVAGDKATYDTLYASLDEDEQRRHDDGHIPSPFPWLQHTCSAENATREAEVTLDFGDGLVSIGHVDLYWVVTMPSGRKLVIVVDMKWSRWTSTVDSLQLAAYGTALCFQHDADEYLPGIWAIDEGKYIWGQPVDVMSVKAAATLETLAHAAGNRADVGSRGRHCLDCYDRLHCPEWLMPPSVADELQPFTDGEALEGMDNDSALRLLLDAKRAVETGERVLENLKARAQRTPIVDHEAGKMYAPVHSAGRKGVRLKVLRERYPAIADELTETGRPITSFRWINRK